MRVSVMLLGLVCLCAMVIGTAAPLAQEDDVRGAFLTSRPKQKPASSGPATKPNRRRPKPAAVSNNPGKSPDKTPATAKTPVDRKSTRLNSSHSQISYAVF